MGQPAKRFAAIVLPDLACELARAHQLVDAEQYFALIVDDAPHGQQPIRSNDVLAAVDTRAWHVGIRPGQCVSEASAFVSNLQIARLDAMQLDAARELIAELALHYGTTAALTLKQPPQQHQSRGASKRNGRRSNVGRAVLAPALGYPLGTGAGPLDTVWLDISGCAELCGGEAALCEQLRARIGELGHRTRIAIADGPRVAQAVARWGAGSQGEALIVPSGQSAQHLAGLPTAALPLDLEQLSWLSKLGVLRVADLTRLDRPRLAHRLGPCAQDILLLLAGHDNVPLCPYDPPRDIAEQAQFDEPISSSEPLLFVLRGLIARAIARLDLRGQACRTASLLLRYDPGVVALHNQTATSLGPEHSLEVELPVPLCREQELRRALHAKIERLVLPAPVVLVKLTLGQLGERPGYQIDLGHHGEPEPTALPTLLAELSAWLGPERVGTLELVDSHQPEKRSRLIPVSLAHPKLARITYPILVTPQRWQLSEPSRILQQPIDVGPLRQGERLAASSNVYTIADLHLLGRIDEAYWWTQTPICRDYARGVLLSQTPLSAGYNQQTPASTGTQIAEAWLYINRQTGRGFLQGWFD